MRLVSIISLLVLALAGRAHADGWGQCGKCSDNRASLDGAQVGSSLLLVGLVSFGIGRRRRSS